MARLNNNTMSRGWSTRYGMSLIVPRDRACRYYGVHRDGVTRPAMLTLRGAGTVSGRRHSLLGSPAPPLTERARSIFICDPQLHHC